MRLVTFRTAGGTRAGRLEGDEVVALDWPDAGALIASGEDWVARAAGASGERLALAGLDLAPPVLNPPAIVCVGRNYAAHAEEMRAEVGGYPILFAKYASSLLGPNDDLVLPAVSEKVDWEAELAFVIGRRGRNLDEEGARACIGAYTVANDVSMRDWQRRTTQFLQGKTFEASNPVGPFLATPDELPASPEDGLRITCQVDDKVVQDGTTKDMVFPVAEVAAYISTFMTLEPGTLVLSGTPDGVGAGRTPPMFLRPGQVLRTAVEGLGELVNRCVAAS